MREDFFFSIFKLNTISERERCNDFRITTTWATCISIKIQVGVTDRIMYAEAKIRLDAPSWLATKSILRIASIKLNYFLIKSHPRNDSLIKSSQYWNLLYSRKSIFSSLYEILHKKIFFITCKKKNIVIYSSKLVYKKQYWYQINFQYLKVWKVSAHNKNANSKERGRERVCFIKPLLVIHFDWLKSFKMFTFNYVPIYQTIISRLNYTR